MHCPFNPALNLYPYKSIMKKLILTTIAGLVGAYSATAEEINSQVIHNYSFVGASFNYLDVGSGMYGGTVEGSYETHNIVFDAEGGYFSNDFDLWTVGGGVGYVVRLAENHFNVIPRVGVS